MIDLSLDEMSNMCGNMLMVKGANDEHYVVMSERARKELSSINREILESNYKIISTELDTIETIGGGSARCMIAELF